MYRIPDLQQQKTKAENSLANGSNGAHLILIEISDDNTNKESQSNHAAKKNKDVDVDAMDLQERGLQLDQRFGY